MGKPNHIRRRVSSLSLAMLVLTSLVQAQDATTVRKTAVPIKRRAIIKSALLDLDRLPNDWQQHPMTPALLFAAQHYQHACDNVHDFTCILVKRERIDGELGGYQYLATKVRREQRIAGQVVTPFSVYIQFLSPSKIRGRKVLYVDGQHENKLVVRNGGRRFRNIMVKLSPHSEGALRESRYAITELGLTSVGARLIERAQDDIRADPTGANTEVSFFRDAKIDDRPCTHIRVVHPKQAPGMEFYLVNIYVDDELKVPLRVDGYAWPKSPGGAPPLVEEYTYTRLKLNVGLTDEDFSIDRLAPSTASR